MNFSVWLSQHDVERMLEMKGLNLITIRTLLKEFGYKTGNDCKKELGLRESILSCKLAYYDEEWEDLLMKFGVVVEYLKTNHNAWNDAYVLGVWRDSAGEFQFYGRGSKSCYKYKANHRLDTILRTEINENYDLNIYTGDE